MKYLTTTFTFFIILGLISNFNFCCAEPVSLNYALILSMPEKVRMEGNYKVGFTVIGLGNFTSASLIFQSDEENIIIDSYESQVEIHKFNESNEIKKVRYLEKYSGKEENQYLSILIEGQSCKLNERILIKGIFEINSNKLSDGTYNLKGSFIAVNNEGSYLVEDTLVFTKQGRYTYFKEWGKLIFPALLAIPVKSLWDKLYERIQKSKDKREDSKIKPSVRI